jgi:hypothetical protein
MPLFEAEGLKTSVSVAGAKPLEIVTVPVQLTS